MMMMMFILCIEWFSFMMLLLIYNPVKKETYRNSEHSKSRLQQGMVCK